jgi:hypothetical protein
MNRPMVKRFVWKTGTSTTQQIAYPIKRNFHLVSVAGSP